MPLRDTFRRAVNERLKDPAFRRFACDAVDVLQRGPMLFGCFEGGETIEIPFMDLYCQTDRAGHLAFEDLVMTASAWQDIQHGVLAYQFLDAPSGPCRDADTEGNCALLASMVAHHPSLVDADFWGGKLGEDGFLRFDQPPIQGFRGHATDEAGSAVEPSNDEFSGRCCRFPLEVGYCLPDQMQMQLDQCRCVARYPYGHSLVVLFERIDSSRRRTV